MGDGRTKVCCMRNLRNVEKGEMKMTKMRVFASYIVESMPLEIRLLIFHLFWAG